jgi:hypothetical protein
MGFRENAGKESANDWAREAFANPLEREDLEHDHPEAVDVGLEAG